MPHLPRISASRNCHNSSGIDLLARTRLSPLLTLRLRRRATHRTEPSRASNPSVNSDSTFAVDSLQVKLRQNIRNRAPVCPRL
jgi:hypothetical protein